MAFGRSDDDFVANCIVQQGEDGLIMSCQPSDKIGGQPWSGSRPVLGKIENGKFNMMDDGGTPAPVLAKLLRHIEKNALG